MNNDAQRQLIESYLVAPESDIERSIGRILLAQEGATEAAINDLRLTAHVQEYLHEKLPIFHEKICVEWNWRGRMKDRQFVSNIEIVAAIADLILPFVGGPPAILVATLLFKRGIDWLCP